MCISHKAHILAIVSVENLFKNYLKLSKSYQLLFGC